MDRLICLDVSKIIEDGSRSSPGSPIMQRTFTRMTIKSTRFCKIPQYPFSENNKGLD